jgi:hypothetical protein
MNLVPFPKTGTRRTGFPRAKTEPGSPLPYARRGICAGRNEIEREQCEGPRSAANRRGQEVSAFRLGTVPITPPVLEKGLVSYGSIRTKLASEPDAPFLASLRGPPHCSPAKSSRPAQILVGRRTSRCRARSSGAVRVRSSGPYETSPLRTPTPMQRRDCLILYLVPREMSRKRTQGPFLSSRLERHRSHPRPLRGPPHCSRAESSRPAQILVGRQTRRYRARSSGAVRVRSSGPYEA